MTLSGVPDWPVRGVVRVHPAPLALPAVSEVPGPYRFDDPRPNTRDRFLVRYAATSVRGCLLEILDWMRDNPAASARESRVDADDDPDLVEPPATYPGAALAEYLTDRRVASLDVAEPDVVSIVHPTVQKELDDEPAVRAVLDGHAARAALLEESGDTVHLDNAAVRLPSEIGRHITRACSLALYDRDPQPDVIHFRSRHDDDEDCWAIYGHVAVVTLSESKLSPSDRAHRKALTSVADLWDLELPREWSR